MSEPSQSETVDDSPRRRGGWVPATVVVLVIFGLVVAPFLLALAAPSRAEGTVGVFERVTLTTEDGGRLVLGGFIAPEGWMRIDDDSDEPAFLLQDGGSALVTVSLRTDAGDASALLQEGIPAGASLSPIRSLDLGTGLDAAMIEFDLQAGDAPTQRIAACSQASPGHCLLVEVVSDGQGDGRPDSLMPEVRDMLLSAEVM